MGLRQLWGHVVPSSWLTLLYTRRHAADNENLKAANKETAPLYNQVCGGGGCWLQPQ